MLCLSAILLATTALALPPAFAPYPYAQYNSIVDGPRNNSGSPLVVDLGYSIYRGYVDEPTGLRTWRGIRYGKDTREYRWQPSEAPSKNRTQIVNADRYGTLCPQAPNAGYGYTYWDSGLTTEDCLFLNVQAPSGTSSSTGNSTGNGTGLPVLVGIHGGGYGSGSNNLDFSKLINANGDQFIAVSIQYRLNAFGFLSSDEVQQKGTPNAGLLDQQLALKWVQQYIHLFGGNKNDVTIFGQSAGGGSVMLHDIAYGGTLGTKLFRNSISSSPYLPFQYDYNDPKPSQDYDDFVAAAGCDTANAAFECLLEQDLQTLIGAATNVSQSGVYYTWAFVPVTDGTIIQERPSQALAESKVNGINHLTGNNALEGAAFVPTGIETIDDLVDYLRVFFPGFSNDDIGRLLDTYPIGNASTDPDARLWATDGSSNGPTNLNQSTAATGQQQRAIAIVGESILICPSYWLAEAYSSGQTGGKAWKYSFSIPNAQHGYDTYAYLRDFYSPDFSRAFREMYGNFILEQNPSIDSAIANGASTGNESAHPISNWPAYSLENPIMADFNTTCPEIIIQSSLPFCGVEGDVQNRIRLVDAYEWEAGRGERCEFWREMGAKVPE